MDAKHEHKERKKLNSQSQSEYDELDNTMIRFGKRYSHFAVLLMICLMSVPGVITLAPNFTSAKMNFTCSAQSPFTDSDSTDITDCTVDTQQCQTVFNCSGEIHTAECSSFDFNDEVFEETIVSKFQLVCDRQYLESLPTALYFLGFLFGCTIYGRLADKFGRTRVMAVGALNLALCTAAASQAPAMWLYCIAQFLSGFGCGGFHTIDATYASEMAVPKTRHIAALSLHHGWAVGIMLGTLVAYYERHYQWLLLWFSVCAAPLVLIAILLCEVPRWLCSVGKFSECDKSYRRIAKFSGKKLNDNFSSRSLYHRQQIMIGSTLSVQSQERIDELYEPPPAGFLDLFRTPGIRYITMCVWFLYFTASMAFFGISLGIGNLGGDIFLNQLYCTAVEIPARVLATLTGHRIRRRISVMIVFGSLGLCLLVTAGVFHIPELRWLCIIFSMIGKFWATIAFDLALLYAAEAFPTVIRAVGIGNGSTLARAGALVGTVVLHLRSLWGPLPFIVFAIGPLCAILIAMRMPETMGRRLPDTLLEGEDFALGHRVADSLLEIPLK